MTELDPGEHESIQIGDHSITIRNNNGEPEIYLRDHMQMHVSGEWKRDVDIVYTSGEFGASFERVGEREFFERFTLGETDE